MKNQRQGEILPEQSLDPAEKRAAVPKPIRKPKRLRGENVVGSNERRKANPWSAAEWIYHSIAAIGSLATDSCCGGVMATKAELFHDPTC